MYVATHSSFFPYRFHSQQENSPDFSCPVAGLASPEELAGAAGGVQVEGAAGSISWLSRFPAGPRESICCLVEARWHWVLCPNCSEEVLSLVWCRAKVEVKDAVSCAALPAVPPSPPPPSPSNEAAGVCGLALAPCSLGRRWWYLELGQLHLEGAAPGGEAPPDRQQGDHKKSVLWRARGAVSVRRAPC